MNDHMLIGFALVIVLSCFFVALPVHADDYTDFVSEDVVEEISEKSEAASGVVAVADAAIAEKLDAILEQLTSANEPDEPAEESITEETARAVDYTAQLTEIEVALSRIETALQPATLETAEPENAFVKPFEEYSVTESIMLVLLVAGIVYLGIKATTVFM